MPPNDELVTTLVVCCALPTLGLILALMGWIAIRNEVNRMLLELKDRIDRDDLCKPYKSDLDGELGGMIDGEDLELNADLIYDGDGSTDGQL